MKEDMKTAKQMPRILSEEELENIVGGGLPEGGSGLPKGGSGLSGADSGLPGASGCMDCVGKVENLKSDGCEIYGVEFVGGLAGTTKGGKIHV